MHGKGVCVYKNGSLFEVYFYQGKRHKGRYIAIDSYIFTGYWEKGRMDGLGCEVRLDGSTSQVVYKDG